MKIRVALIGNPNVGKSVVFNNLTGSRQHTGNWPGKTVEMKSGYYKYKGYEFELIDLPGVYSLSALSEDERVAREYLIDNRPDVVVDILNASQLERNLYLTLLLIELQLRLVVVLNMYDVVRSRGDKIDIEKLSERLGAPVVITTAPKKEGMEELKEAILKAVPPHVLTGESNADEHLPGDIDKDHLHYHPRLHHHGQYERLRPPSIKYSPKIEKSLKEIVMLLENERELLERYPPRWVALRLLERDPEILPLVVDDELREKILAVGIQ
ncbi:MAG: FeoB small GTPase domain-containing protein [Candidatus Thorarchaeota archaeon]